MMIPGYESIAIFEDFFGEELNEDMIARLASMPDYQLRELCDRLDYAFKHWFRSRKTYMRSAKTAMSIPPFQPIYSHDANLRYWGPTLEHWLKCSLLYFPGAVAIPDPIGAADNIEYIDTALEPRDYMLKRVRRGLINGLRFSLQLRPLIAANVVVTIPWPSIAQLRDDSVELGYMTAFEDMPSYGGVSRAELIEFSFVSENFWRYNDDDNPTDVDIESMVAAEWLWTGTHLGNSPVAADAYSLNSMMGALESEVGAALADRQVAELISQFRIPGADHATLNEVVKLRLNDEAFAEFRSAFEAILLAVCNAHPGDETTFSTEFSRHAYGTLAQERAQLKRRHRNSDALEGILTGVFLLGAAGIEASITKEVPIGSMLASAATVSGWLVPYLKKRANFKSTGGLTRTFFSYLLPTEGTSY